MTTSDTKTLIAESDLLAALEGIVNTHLLEGIADGDGNVHEIRVVIWRNVGPVNSTIPGLTSLAVIVHVDGESIAPFHGSSIAVALDTLSHAATMIVVRTETLVSAELDRRQAEADAAEDAAYRPTEESLDHAQNANITSQSFASSRLGLVIGHHAAHLHSEHEELNDDPFSGDELARIRYARRSPVGARVMGFGHLA